MLQRSLFPMILCVNSLVGQSTPFITATTGGIRGITVVNGKHSIVAGVEIKCIALDGRVRSTYSDSNGNFRMGLLQPGTYKVVISKQGHSPILKTTAIVKAGAWLTPTIPPIDYCGVGAFEPIVFKAVVESYEYLAGQTFVLTADELSRLPIR